MKVMTVVGTRPELIRLSRVMAALDRYVDHVIVHTGQNYDYELNQVFFNELEIHKPDYFLGAAGATACETIGQIIAKIDKVIREVQPDALLLLGDTNSCLAAYPAKRQKIPIFHMEAGNRCFDFRVPEEINRRIVDHISDINLTYSEHARRYLMAEGLRPETVIKTGSPMKEVLHHYRDRIDQSNVLERLELQKGNYFIVSSHREENVDDEENFGNLLNTLNAIAELYKCPIIFSTHPRTRKRVEEYGIDKMDSRIQFLKPMGLFDYVKLQIHAKCVISDSGTITEESSILSFPAVTIRQAHERPEGMDEGAVIMCGLQKERVMESIAVVVKQFQSENQRIRMPQDYDTDNVSQKVVRIILSYTDYVNRNVWKKANS